MSSLKPRLVDDSSTTIHTSFSTPTKVNGAAIGNHTKNAVMTT